MGNVFKCGRRVEKFLNRDHQWYVFDDFVWLGNLTIKLGFFERIFKGHKFIDYCIYNSKIRGASRIETICYSVPFKNKLDMEVN